MQDSQIVRTEYSDVMKKSYIDYAMMGTEVPPRRAFIYENATEAELDI